MTCNEAKDAIKKEFMSRYERWMLDRIELNDNDYGWKYGWQKSEKLMSLKDNLTAVAMFQKYIYPMRKVETLEKEIGVERKAIFELAREGWMSAVQRKWAMYYFVSQQRAKEIWKEAKGK